MTETTENLTLAEGPGLSGDLAAIEQQTNYMLGCYGYQGAFRMHNSPRTGVSACSYREAEYRLQLALSTNHPLCWCGDLARHYELVLAQALARLYRRRFPSGGRWVDFDAGGASGRDAPCTPFVEWYVLLSEEAWAQGNRRMANLFMAVGRLLVFDRLVPTADDDEGAWQSSMGVDASAKKSPTSLPRGQGDPD